MFEVDFSENSDISRKSLCRTDQMFMNKVSTGNHYRSDGQYKISLPFREDDLKLPNNNKLAGYRLRNLKSNFEKEE